MRDQPIRRRTLLAASVTAGFAGTAGCLSKQQPKASHWAAGIRWSDPPGEVFREMGFSPLGGGVFTGPANAARYIRVNGGELHYTQFKDDSVPAGRGDHVEYIIDFDTWRLGEETVFEYTIPEDEDLVGVLAGFAECLHYRDTDEWIVRPFNVDLDTDLLGRQQETLVVRVERENRDENPDWFVWGHDESIREAIRDEATEYYSFDADVDLEFVDPGQEAAFGPASFSRVGMAVYDRGDAIAGVSYSTPLSDS